MQHARPKICEVLQPLYQRPGAHTAMIPKVLILSAAAGQAGASTANIRWAQSWFHMLAPGPPDSESLRQCASETAGVRGRDGAWERGVPVHYAPLHARTHPIFCSIMINGKLYVDLPLQPHFGYGKS